MSRPRRHRGVVVDSLDGRRGDGRLVGGNAPVRSGERPTLGPLLERFEDLLDLLLAQRLLAEQLTHQFVEHLTVGDEAVEGLLMGVLQQLSHLVVDDLGGDIGVVTLLTGRHAQEWLGIPRAQLDGADRGRQTVLGHHGTSHLGGLLDVVGGTGRRVVEDELLGCPSAHHVGHGVEQLTTSLGVLVGIGHDHRVAQGTSARQDGDLLHRIGTRHRGSDQGVPALVVGGDETFVLVHDPRLLLRTGDDAIDGLVELGIADHRQVLPGGEQGGLVEHIGQIGTRHSRGTASDRGEVDVIGHRLALGMHLQNLETTLHVGGLHGDLTIEPPRTQQGRVEDIGPVGGGNEDDVGVDVESVHLDEQLVEGLLTLVVATAHAGTTVASHRVDLVDEDDGR